MMPSLTVRDLFLSTEHGEPSDGLRLPAIPSGLSHLFNDFEWRRLVERVDGLLDINVVDVLLAGWRKHREVRAQLRTTAADPSRTVLVQLRRHLLDSTHHPSIELRVKKRRVAELSFPIVLTFEIEAAELTLRAGEICEIRTEDVKVRGTVKFEAAVMLERPLSPSRLPGRIVLHPAWLLVADRARKSRGYRALTVRPSVPDSQTTDSL